MAEHAQQTFYRNVMKKTTGIDTDKPFEQFKDFVVPESIVRAFGGIKSIQDSPSYTAQIHALYAAYVIARSGDPSFSLSPDILQALRDTEMRDIPSSELKIPFTGINVDFPEGTLGGSLRTVSRLMILQAPGDKFRVVYYHGDRTSYMNFTVEEGKTVHECMSHAMQHQWDNLTDPVVIRRFQSELDQNDYRELDVTRLAINTVLYLTAPNADVVQDKAKERALHTKLQGMKGSRKRDVLLSKLAQEKQNKRYIVGAKFRLAREYKATLTESGKQWALKHRVHVMGHHKMQPCGTKLAQRKRIWVQPYWKGPTFAEMIQKGYVVT